LIRINGVTFPLQSKDFSSHYNVCQIHTKLKKKIEDWWVVIIIAFLNIVSVGFLSCSFYLVTIELDPNLQIIPKQRGAAIVKIRFSESFNIFPKLRRIPDRCGSWRVVKD